MTRRLLFVAVFSLAFAKPAFANWWIVRSSDGQCLVVDIEPAGIGVTKMGKEVYQTEEQAEAEAKRVCKRLLLALACCACFPPCYAPRLIGECSLIIYGESYGREWFWA